jgi:hypothetical protein
MLQAVVTFNRRPTRGWSLQKALGRLARSYAIGRELLSFVARYGVGSPTFSAIHCGFAWEELPIIERAANSALVLLALILPGLGGCAIYSYRPVDVRVIDAESAWWVIKSLTIPGGAAESTNAGLGHYLGRDLLG